MDSRTKAAPASASRRGAGKASGLGGLAIGDGVGCERTESAVAGEAAVGGEFISEAAHGRCGGAQVKWRAPHRRSVVAREAGN